jgi:hypothetical protein
MFNLKMIVFDILSPLNILKRRKKSKFDYWGLGVDCCTCYSSPFSVRNHCITIEGFQEAIAENAAIRYSIVKKKWWRKKVVYDEIEILGNYHEPHCFQVTINDIPNGENYQVEVFNGFNIACGHFIVEEREYLAAKPVSQPC